MENNFKTTCSYCGVGCGVDVKKDRWGRLSVEGDADYPVNQGMLCSKGRNLHQVAMDESDRLLYPEMRKSRSHQLRRVDWNKAFEYIAETFAGFIKTYGPDSVAFYVSGQMLTEEYYVANKLMKGFIGSNNIDTNSRLCMSSAVVGYKKALGDDACPISYDDIELADCFLITGANPAWCHPIIFRRLENHKQKNPNVKIIVVDPRNTQTCSTADLHLQIQPGTDITLTNAIAKYLIDNKLINQAFIDKHVSGFDELKKEMANVSLAEAAARCRIPQAQIELAARYIGKSKGFISMWAMGLNQSSVGTRKNLSLLNLSLITGQIGKPGAGPFSLTGQPNAMGGREVGGLANLLAAHRDLDNPKHRAEVATYWGVNAISEKPGLSATEMIDAAANGRLKAIWVICTNPAVSMPNVHKIERALSRTKLVVVQDISRNSDTVGFADVILPAAGWLEKQGTMTNSERRITYLPKVLDAPGEAKPDSWILCKFAEKMGWKKSFDYPDEEAIFDEHKELTRGTNIDITGMSYARLRQERSLQWPCPAPDNPGTIRLFEDARFFTPSGKANVFAVPDSHESQTPTHEFPFILTTGRIRDQWHTMTRTGKVSKLQLHIDHPYLEMHPIDARQLGLKNGDTVSVTSFNGEVNAPVLVTEDIKEGVTFLPMHWGKGLNGDLGRANNLTTSVIDKQSKQPDLKFTTVDIRKIEKDREKIVVVGAGAAAREFIEAYRTRNMEDEVHVFGREPHLFYNRILLPDYIAGERDWQSLLTSDDALLEKLDITYHAGTEITKIKIKSNEVRDDKGEWHQYDKLVLCTGSRPFIPPGIPEMANIFSLRTRGDADKIIRRVALGSNLIVMGGGLLGIELAAALNRIGHNVTVIEYGPRLMARQLDKLASQLLREELEDRGIHIICSDAIAAFKGKRALAAVKTREGLELQCDALFVAVGIRPNIELGSAAGLEHNRGIIVNDQLQTSNPDIYAMGEIAEHNGNLYGITPAAQAQAKVAAAHISGDIWTRYRGSVLFNILKIKNLPLCSIGMTEVPENDSDYEEIILSDRKNKYYKKCIIHKNRLLGAILIGDNSEFAEFRELIENRTELDDRRGSLLRSGFDPSTARPKADGRLVCACNNVGEGNLEKLIREGCTELETLCSASKAGTGCGSCKPEVAMILENSLRRQESEVSEELVAA